MTSAAGTTPNAHDEAHLPPVDQMARANFEMVVRTLADDLAFGTDDSLFVGSGLEYAQSRPYEPGDPVKQIDWKITARSTMAYIKEYETLKRMSTYLVVDTSGSMAASSTRLSKHDLAVWITAAIALVAVRRLSPVAVVGAGQRRTRVEPSMATGDLWQSLEPLRHPVAGEATDVAGRLTELEPRLQRRSLVVSGPPGRLHGGRGRHAGGCLGGRTRRAAGPAGHLARPRQRPVRPLCQVISET